MKPGDRVVVKSGHYAGEWGSIAAIGTLHSDGTEAASVQIDRTGEYVLFFLDQIAPLLTIGAHTQAPTRSAFEGAVTCLYLPDTEESLHQRFHDTDFCDRCGAEWHVDDLATCPNNLILCPQCRRPSVMTDGHILRWGLTFAALLMALAAILTAWRK